MAQNTTSITSKTPGTSLLASDINDIVSVVNNNATDSGARYTTIGNTHNDQDTRLTTAESSLPYFVSYTVETLPETADEGTVAFNSTDNHMMMFKDGKWYNLHLDIPVSLSKFVFVINIDTAGYTFTLPLLSTGAYNFSVEWGDSSNDDTITAWDDAAKAHTFASVGQYTISISGEITGWSFNAHADSYKITSITDIDILKFAPAANNAFYKCENLTSVGGTEIDLTGVTNIENIFRDCKTLTSLPPVMDISLCTAVRFAFLNNYLLHTIPTLNFAAATAAGSSFRDMFFGCRALTAAEYTKVTIDTSNSSELTGLFFDNRSATQLPAIALSTDPAKNVAIENLYRNCWLITSIPTFDTSRVNNFKQTFRSCRALQSFHFINTSRGTDFWRTWNDCRSLPSFPGNMDFKSSTRFESCWESCQALTEFPAPLDSDMNACTNFKKAWKTCTVLEIFPSISMNNGTDFTEAWQNCSLNIQSIENILASLVANGRSNLNTSFSGGSNASKATWTATAATHYDTLVNTRGWTIAHNT